MAIGGAILRFGATLIYALAFCCAAIILGIYSYFLAAQADRDVNIPRWQQAVEGLSGAIVLYTIFAVLLTCCLGGKKIFAFLGILLDLLCCGAMVAIAVLTRHGASSCSGYVRTPLGNGDARLRQGFSNNGRGDRVIYAASLGTVCRLNKVCFAVAIVGAQVNLLFLVSIPFQLFMTKHHAKEKRYGPGPSNGYTKGSGKKFWQRNQRNRGVGDPEVAAAPVAAGGLAAPMAHDMRPSHDTAYTGSTVAAPGVDDHHHHHHKKTNGLLGPSLAGGYHTAPTGTYQTPATNY
ncbi:hypothetical protein ACEQ8H_003066 [Pleosporales sp. CAS-2024a]